MFEELKEAFEKYGEDEGVTIQKITWPLMAGRANDLYEAVEDVIELKDFIKAFGIVLLGPDDQNQIDEMLEGAEDDSDDLREYLYNHRKFGFLATITIPFKENFTESGYTMTGPYHQEVIYFDGMDEFLRKAASAVDHFEARDRMAEAAKNAKRKS